MAGGREQHGDHLHSHGVGSRGSGASSNPSTTYNWQIHHPFGGVENRVAVEVAPWRGLLPRWRFVIPGDYSGVVRWGVGSPGGGTIDTDVKREARGGPVALHNGPTVVWFGGHEALSSSVSAYLVFEGEPPHYLAFGQAEVPGGPPGTLEGISFGQSHPPHPPVGQPHQH